MRRLFILTTLAACQIFAPSRPDETGGPGPSDTDTDTDADTDTDTDTDSGSGGSDLDCTLNPPPQSSLDECVTALVSCGSRTVATMQGGTTAFDADAYENWFCTPFPESDYRSAERVYAITVEDKWMTVSLESPCDELDLFVIHWNAWGTDQDCPAENTVLTFCEVDDSGAGGELSFLANGTYLIIVEAREASSEVFQLDISCE